MRYFIGALFFFFSLANFAETCPSVELLLHSERDGYRLSTPPGWTLKIEERDKTNYLVFKVAAWGNHQSPSERVRCHYYDPTTGGSAHVMLESEKLFTRPLNWKTNDNKYSLCVTRNFEVGDCSF